MTDLSRYDEVVNEARLLYEAKNKDYGDSFSNLYEKFGLSASAVRIYDKTNRLITLVGKEAEVKDESVRDTLIDLANYAIMTVIEMDKTN